ncbi:MAG: zinc dependent phospholipase C family protein [Anaerolineales bacterium]|nr:zinc dependent phospholipase C family protein [Anaerolineales bacterium]
MATWIAHLRIAENLLERIPGLLPAPFAVGSIAPDSGIPDEKWEKFTPPGDVTHFKAPDGCVHPMDDLGFFREHLSRPERDKEKFSFLWGYFCHLVTDNLWRLRILRPTIERYKARFDADPNFIWEVKKDWYGLDFVYVRNHPEALFWRVFLNCKYPVNYLDILLPEGVRQRIDYIKTYYRRTDAETDEIFSRERVYLAGARMDRFVKEAAEVLDRGIHRLQQGEIQNDGLHSLLEVAF